MTIVLPFPLPRDYLRTIETALANGQYIAYAEALHSARPRDLAEVFVLLPEDVEIIFREDSYATLNHA